MDVPLPLNVVLDSGKKLLHLDYPGEQRFSIPSLLLRAFSPSAEMKVAGADTRLVQALNADVGIESIETVGNYALRLIFDDGHNTGLYTWEYLYELGTHLDQYQAKLRDSRRPRDC